MDNLLKSRREREAGESLKQLIRLVIGRNKGVEGYEVDLTSAEEAEIEQFVHEVVEAAAEKGRGQIKS